jgi:hypothetical protein
MQDETSCSHDSGSGRRRELAMLLARAISRSCVPRPARRSPSVIEERTSPSGPVLPLVVSSEILSKRSRPGLEVPGETRLTLHAG